MKRLPKGRMIISPVSKASLEKPVGRWERWRDYFWEGGISSHLQAAAALFAVGFAVWTVSSWKEQEVTKKRSELAYEVMSRTAHAKSIVEPMMNWGTIAPSEAEFYERYGHLILNGSSRTSVVGLKERIGELKVLAAAARFTFRNNNLDSAVEAVMDGVDRLSWCYEELGRKMEAPSAGRDEVWRADVKSLLNGLSVHAGGDLKKTFYPADLHKCELEKVKDNASAVEKLLLPELTMSGRLETQEGYDAGGLYFDHPADPKDWPKK